MEADLGRALEGVPRALSKGRHGEDSQAPETRGRRQPSSSILQSVRKRSSFTSTELPTSAG